MKPQVVGILLVFCSMAVAGQNTGPACEKLWWEDSAEFVDRDLPDYIGLLKAWKGRARQCKGSGIYEARLAAVYFYLEQPSKAREALDSLKKIPKGYEDDVALAYLLTEGKELLLAGKTDQKDFEGLEGRYLGFIEKHPDSAEGRALLGGLQTTVGKYREALPHLAAATHGTLPNQQRWGLFRNLTITLAHLGRYEDAYRAAGETISLNKKAMEDPWFMYAAAMSQAGRGNVEEAKTTLTVILSKRPEIKDDPEYLDAIRFVVVAEKKARAEPKK